MIEILKTISALGGWDWWMSSYDGWKLIFSSGTSEISRKPFFEFHGISYISCPEEFSHANFRLAEAAERMEVAKLVPLEETDSVVVIEAETMASMQPHKFFLVAETAVLVSDT